MKRVPERLQRIELVDDGNATGTARARHGILPGQYFLSSPPSNPHRPVKISPFAPVQLTAKQAAAVIAALGADAATANRSARAQLMRATGTRTKRAPRLRSSPAVHADRSTRSER